jgi:branched-chain amino acid transport system ATP-binding protein
MTPLLETRGLVKAFGSFRAVDGIDLRVQEGTIHGVIGPNGAGKSTLFNLLTGHLRPTAGTVTFAGDEITGKAPHAVTRRGIARAFQITNVFPRLSVLESVACAIVARERRSSDFVTTYQRSCRDEAVEIIDEVGLASSAERLSRELSHGDQRALEVALAVATRPKLLLLDEPTAGMSPYETGNMVGLVAKLARTRGLTILLCEHDMSVVFRISTTITVLHEGRILAEGSPTEVQRDAQVMQVYLGTTT